MSELLSFVAANGFVGALFVFGLTIIIALQLGVVAFFGLAVVRAARRPILASKR